MRIDRLFGFEQFNLFLNTTYVFISNPSTVHYNYRNIHTKSTLHASGFSCVIFNFYHLSIISVIWML